MTDEFYILQTLKKLEKTANNTTKGLSGVEDGSHRDLHHGQVMKIAIRLVGPCPPESTASLSPFLSSPASSPLPSLPSLSSV